MMISGRKKVVIIGAGAAGLFAARALKKQGIDCLILEREAHAGGKCHTWSDPDMPLIKTELGAALLAPNYGVVLDAVHEKGLAFEESLSTARGTIPMFQHMDALSWPEKLTFTARLTLQWSRFTSAVRSYHQARNNQQPLPEQFETPFTEYASQNGMELICDLVRPLVSGFGYGAMEDIPAYCVMEYMGLGTLPAMAAGPVLGKSALIGIRGGFQHLMERIAEDFRIVYSARIQHIERSSEGVNVTYCLGEESCLVEADALVLAIPPMQWSRLGMRLTDVEQACVDAVSYYRYPVAVCRMAGLPPEHQFVPEALEKGGEGHLALITTRDNRHDPDGGRLATAYINLPPGDNAFTLDKKTAERRLLKEELRNRDGVQRVKIVHTKIWEDYMPTLPWSHRLRLEARQMHPDTATLYVGACPLGGFEDVRCVADQATRAVERYMSGLKPVAKSRFSYAGKELSRAYGFFFSIPRVQPMADAELNDAEASLSLSS
ncbi:FAD-dependent oxidoreductase [Legionella sp. CNM-4043-24]|uniref:FAD-dependent oxidoreductase n=1 Tax=Legionella sp. CNM-4043-24 TaxID=3421646 RepID=UPI00403ADC7A